MRILILCCLFVIAMPSYCKNLGTHGQVFPIKEQDFRTYIQNHLAKLQASGAIKKYNEQAKKRIISHILNLPELPLSTRSDTHTFYVDPSIRLTQDIRDSMGRILIPAGTIVNPFKTIHLKKTLIFFDGNNPQQVRWVKENYTKYHWSKLILTGGKLKDNANLFGRIYYDQHGIITAKLHIHHTPAVAVQSGLKWKITEIGSKYL
jgi:conjugal transfer pilus assembly protein TraW